MKVIDGITCADGRAGHFPRIFSMMLLTPALTMVLTLALTLAFTWQDALAQEEQEVHLMAPNITMGRGFSFSDLGNESFLLMGNQLGVGVSVGLFPLFFVDAGWEYQTYKRTVDYSANNTTRKIDLEQWGNYVGMGFTVSLVGARLIYHLANKYEYRYEERYQDTNVLRNEGKSSGEISYYTYFAYIRDPESIVEFGLRYDDFSQPDFSGGLSLYLSLYLPLLPL